MLVLGRDRWIRVTITTQVEIAAVFTLIASARDAPIAAVTDVERALARVSFHLRLEDRGAALRLFIQRYQEGTLVRWGVHAAKVAGTAGEIFRGAIVVSVALPGDVDENVVSAVFVAVLEAFAKAVWVEDFGAIHTRHHIGVGFNFANTVIAALRTLRTTSMLRGFPILWHVVQVIHVSDDRGLRLF